MPSVTSDAVSSPYESRTNTELVKSFFGAMGCALAIVLTTFGAAYGTAKSSVAIFSCGVLRPDRLMQNTYSPIRFHLESEDGRTNKLLTLRDRKSTRLNSSHSQISYAVFC